MKEITAEERQRRAAKAAQTVRERKERKAAEEQAQRNDRQRAIDVCRSIRDSADSTDRDKLDAIKMLAELT